MKIPFLKKRTGRVVSLEDARGVVRNPHNAWIILIRLFFAGLVLVMIISGFVFYKINNSTQVEVGTDGSVSKEAIDTVKLRQVIDTFKKKQEKFDSLLIGVPGIVDPSK